LAWPPEETSKVTGEASVPDRVTPETRPSTWESPAITPTPLTTPPAETTTAEATPPLEMIRVPPFWTL
jgi:hypothetical protein